MRTLPVSWNFLLPPDCPSPTSGSWYAGSCGFSSPLGLPTFVMGSPLRDRGLLVLDRNEGFVSPFGSGMLVSSWLDIPPLFAGICVPFHSGCVAWWSSCVLTVGYTYASFPFLLSFLLFLKRCVGQADLGRSILDGLTGEMPSIFSFLLSF